MARIIRRYSAPVGCVVLGVVFGILWTRRGADPLVRAIGELTPEQQWVIYLRFGADFDSSEVARIMSRRLDEVLQLQRRALVSLRRVLDERGGT